MMRTALVTALLAAAPAFAAAPTDGERLFAAANEPKRFADLSGGHNDGFLVTGERYLQYWQDFLEDLAR